MKYRKYSKKININYAYFERNIVHERTKKFKRPIEESLEFGYIFDNYLFSLTM
jgi:hypothetical protein